jgi:hypothetical protein
VELVKNVKSTRVPKNARNILANSGYFQIRLLFRRSLVSLHLKGKSKFATENSVPSSQTATKILNEWKTPQRNYEKVTSICPTTKAPDVRSDEAGYGNLWP